MDKVTGILAGSRTYIMAAAMALDVLGSQLGWWNETALRTIVEQCLALTFLRMAVK